MKQCIDPSPSPDCFQMLPSPKLLFTREEEEGEKKKIGKLWQTLSLLYYKLQSCLGKPQPVLQKVARD